MKNSLEQMWEDNRDHVRRVLLALTRDVDLAEDCLQDTYVRATSGISGYRGGSPEAWLATVAKNVFYGHARRKWFYQEGSLDGVAEQADDSARVGSDDHLDLLVIRDAVSALDPHLRKALIMKHYGNYDYEEIGSYLCCTPVMAKHKVWRAMQRLRKAIGTEEKRGIACSELQGARFLDWLYGALSPRESADIEAHIVLCASCRRNAAQMRKLAGLLDKAEGDYRILTLIDLDERGRTTRYAWVKQINENQDATCTWAWNAREDWEIEYLALQGEPVEVRWPGTPAPSGFRKFEGDLPRQVPRGEAADAMFIAHPPAGSHWEAQSLVNGIWHYHHKHTPFPEKQALFIVAIRLPKGARLLEAHPAPNKSSTRAGFTSFTWQVLTERVASKPNDPKWQFEAHLEYVVNSR